MAEKTVGNPTGAQWKLCSKYGKGPGYIQTYFGPGVSGCMYGRVPQAAYCRD